MLMSMCMCHVFVTLCVFVYSCGHCEGGKPCSKLNGSCSSCAPGWNGTRCDQPCPPGYHGIRCQEVCPYCRKGEPCDAVTGTCAHCEPGWTGLGYQCASACCVQEHSLLEIVQFRFRTLNYRCTL